MRLPLHRTAAVAPVTRRHVPEQDPSGGRRGTGTAAAERRHSDAMPVLGELTERLWDAIAEGQPVVLTRRGRPAAVVLDIESYAEVEDSLVDERA